MREFVKSMADAAFARAPKQKPSYDRTDKQLIHVSMLHAMKVFKYGKDLKVIIFCNRTNIDFINMR
jgi:hypothetical protein